MERTRATLVVRKQALSFGSQKIHIVAEMESTSLLQDLLQRKAVMELSDKGCFGVIIVTVLCVNIHNVTTGSANLQIFHDCPP